MALFDIFGKKDVTKDLTKRVPFSLSTEFTPYRLYAGKKSASTLTVDLRNATKEVMLTSLVIELPNKIGFDDMMIAKEREMRLGQIAPSEEKEVRVNLHNSLDADKGEYTILLTAIAHYRDYGHVMNAVKKRITLQVV